MLSDGFSVGSGASFTAISEPPPQEIVRTYAYQNVQYFLTQGDGPWGARSWSYDRIGNRLTETRDGLPADVYQYTQNPAGGNSPVLSSIALGMGNTRNFTYGAAGHLESISVGSTGTGMAYDEAGRLSTLTNLFDSENVDLSYDGRGYLSGSSSTADTVSPVYSSDGLLHALVRQGETVAFLYLAGRPVGRVVVGGTGTTVETYTTDHLGTPILVADESGTKVWSGGFEPFGGDGAGGATAAGVELRLPGQVEDESWESVLASSEIYYNVHRWYLPGVGRYSRPDPLGSIQPDRSGWLTASHAYFYANSNSSFFIDPLGLEVVIELGLEVVIENPETADSYEQLKECFPLFRQVAEHFEQDTWTAFGPDRTWTIKDPIYTPATCNQGGSRSQRRTVWVPTDRDCEGTMRCMMHEFYELWLIREAGFAQSGPAGPADDVARRFEEYIPFERCCPCN